jgi:hypothetical protein
VPRGDDVQAHGTAEQTGIHLIGGQTRSSSTATSSLVSNRIFPSVVITGLVPVISIGKVQRLSASGWPGQARP